MEGQQVRETEGGREEYHDIPNEDKRSPSKINANRVRQELPILFTAIRADKSKFPVGSFTEMSVQRKIRDSTGVIAEKATMITPNDVLIEFPLGAPVNEIAQVLHNIEEWEDTPVDTHCIMGEKRYILQVCRDRLEYEERVRQMVREEERRREEEFIDIGEKHTVTSLLPDCALPIHYSMSVCDSMQAAITLTCMARNSLTQ